MAKIKQLKEKKTDEIFYPVTVGEAVIFEDGRSVKDKIEKLSTYIETTYSNLKSLRDNNQLIPGALYRITDYVTTTAQENTRSAGHQFDIIVQAISESVLSEDAKAIQHKYTLEEMPQTAYFTVDGIEYSLAGKEMINSISYLVYKYENQKVYINPQNATFSDFYNEDCGEYKYAFVPDYCDYDNGEGIIAGEGELIFKQDLREFSYFSNSNLAAWKLKYCLDNDESRFAWAKNLYLSPVTHRKCIQGYVSGDNCTYIFVRQPQLDNENGLAWALDNAVEENISIKNYVNNGREDIDTESIGYTQSEDIYIGQSVSPNTFEESITVVDFSEQGKGVIYQMIDEYNNDCPYDFKNIQFLRTQQWHNDNNDWTNTVLVSIPNSDIYYYTFSWAYNSNSTYFIEDTSVTSLQDDENEFVNARNNVLMEYLHSNKIELNNIILVSSPYYDEEFYPQKNNTFKQNCYNNTFGNNIRDNVFDFRNFNWIVFNDYENNQTFGSVYSVHLDEPTFAKIIFMNYASGSIKITSILNYPNT